MIGEYLERIFTRHGLGQEYKEQEPLFLWEEVVGENIAKLTSPLRVRDRVMFVEVQNSVIGHELSLMKEDYISKVNERLGKKRIKDIRFRVGQVGKPGERKGKKVDLKAILLSDVEKGRIEQMVKDIGDERLKKALVEFIVTEKKMEQLRQEEGWKRCPICNVVHDGEDEVCVACKLETG